MLFAIDDIEIINHLHVSRMLAQVAKRLFGSEILCQRQYLVCHDTARRLRRIAQQIADRAGLLGGHQVQDTLSLRGGNVRQDVSRVIWRKSLEEVRGAFGIKPTQNLILVGRLNFIKGIRRHLSIQAIQHGTGIFNIELLQYVGNIRRVQVRQLGMTDVELHLWYNATCSNPGACQRWHQLTWRRASFDHLNWLDIVPGNRALSKLHR